MAPPRRRLEVDYHSENWQSINLSLEFSAVVAVLLLMVFECGRARKRHVFWSKRRYTPHRTPRSMPLGAFAWVPTAFLMPGSDLAALVGLDAYMLLRYTKLAMRLTAFMTFWGLAVLLPLYASADPGDDPADGFYRFTFSNVPVNSRLLWCPVAMVYMFTGHATYLIVHEYEHVLKWRQEWLASGVADTPEQPLYSIVVERLPRELRSDTALKDYFERLFPKQARARAISRSIK